MLPNLHPSHRAYHLRYLQRLFQGGDTYIVIVIGQSQNQNFTWLPNTPVVLAPTNIYRNEERERELTTGIKTNGAARC